MTMPTITATEALAQQLKARGLGMRQASGITFRNKLIEQPPQIEPIPGSIIDIVDRLERIEALLRSVIDLLVPVAHPKKVNPIPAPCRPDGLTAGERYVQLHGLVPKDEQRNLIAERARQQGEVLARAIREVSR
jgi:hypothetical protein